ncbi:MAG: DUF1610 domain-containing protein [Candidatus Micrarchaeota archaeon]|nr:DUF1610 domain-containing protein [Candidatus Micrarchaeota archaeon]
MKCVSCGIDVEVQDNWVQFSCPSCGETQIVRCEKCKQMGNPYRCEKCGFVGP